TVVKVEIGSPYVVKAMEDWSRDPKNKGGIAVGFERNGGFLLGSDIRLNNGNVLKKLATRDAMLPIIAAFSMAREKKCSIGQLVAGTFTGNNASEVWSGLIGSLPAEYEGVSAEDVQYCQQYTATMGQALMRTFSPKEFNIEEVVFLSDGRIQYKTRESAEFVDAVPLPAEKTQKGEEGVFERMNRIRNQLQGYFNEDRKFYGGIVRMNFLDGVRMFFGNNEIAHMRPSGNSPQWRIYSEAKDIKRAMEITDYRFQIYPAIIKWYLEKKKETANVRMDPQGNKEIKARFEDVIFTSDKNKKWVRSDTHWRTWEMKFGPESEHTLAKGIEFPDDNTVTFYHTRVFDATGKLSYMRKKGDTQTEKLTIKMSLTWKRAEKPEEWQLVCQETFLSDKTDAAGQNLDGRSRTTIFKGSDAWMEIGRALNKNIPMGKLVSRPFPVITERARDYFKREGINWLDLIDIAIEPEFTIEALMWDQFKYKQVTAIDVTPEIEDFKSLCEGGADHVTAKLNQGYKYQIRYNAQALRQYIAAAGLAAKEHNPEELIKLYAEALRVRARAEGKGDDAVELVPGNGKLDDGRPSFVSISCFKDDQKVGEGTVQLKELDKNLPYALVRLLNIALASAHIPENEDVNRYPWLVSFIKSQYKDLTGIDLKFEDYGKIRYLVIDKIKPINVQQLQDYYKSVILQFAHSA
ncbi:MAG: hypothetical protein PHS37_07315, partial [Candidatus Omnitrophica bacterium]|nr:hypothetical protein [Candidatus Omnitrophota bacterium]